MLGELNTSHFGFYSNVKEEKTYFGYRTSCPGLIFSKTEPYVIEKIVKDGPLDYGDAKVKKR